MDGRKSIQNNKTVQEFSVVVTHAPYLIARWWGRGVVTRHLRRAGPRLTWHFRRVGVTPGPGEHFPDEVVSGDLAGQQGQ